MAYGKALAALADPTRRAVFEKLRGGASSVADISHGMPVSRPAVSQHLAALKAAGLVDAEKRGTARLYAIRRDGIVELRAWLDGFWDEALARFKDHAEAKA